MSGTHVLALADQAVVSGASFLTTVLIGRSTDSSELGVYAIGVSVLVSLLAIQDSLISLPYAIQWRRPKGTPAERAGNALTHSVLLSALGLVVLMGSALGLAARDAGPELTAMAWALAAVAPFALLRDFGRRFAFARLHMGEALAMDAAAAAIQLAALGLLRWSGTMSAVAALAALGGAYALTSILWLWRARGDFAIRGSQARTAMAESWGLGKWLFAGQITVQVQSYVTYWLSVMVLGAAATGVYAACMSVVSFANPLITGLTNILTPRAVLAWKKEGGAGLLRQAIWDSLFLGAATGAFCIVIVFAGEELMHLLYHGPEYEGQGHTVTVLAAALLAQAVGAPASSALASMERPRAIVFVGSIATVLTVLLVWFLMVEAGLLGAAYGFLLGNVAGAVGRWAAFLAIVPRTCDDPAPVIHALQQLTQGSDDSGWAISRHGEGDHATVFMIHSKDSRPIHQGRHSLVVKLYKPEAALNVENVQAQFDSLSKLHAALNGRVIDGWSISVPEPLSICKSPLALAMTMVSGRNLYSWTATGDDLTPEALDAVARIAVGAIGECWGLGQIHGDLALQNILCDFQAKNLSFVDGGTPESCLACHDVGEQWPPAVRDLAHILSDVVTDVKSSIGNKNARLRRRLFARSALRAFLETVGPCGRKQRLLREIRVCTLAHLAELLEPSWSPQGLWRRLVKQIAVRRLDAILDRMKVELDVRAGTAEEI
jgi:O-antigen/teichoic acid export membrane protein